MIEYDWQAVQPRIYILRSHPCCMCACCSGVFDVNPLFAVFQNTQLARAWDLGAKVVADAIGPVRILCLGIVPIPRQRLKFEFFELSLLKGQHQPFH